DAFVDVILQGDMTAQTKTSLLKKLDEAASVPPTTTETARITAPAAAQAADDAALMNGGDQQTRRERLMARFGQLAVVNAPPVNQEVARIAALILGSPEFQRQ